MSRILLVDFANSYFTHFHYRDNDKAWKFINNIRNITEQFKIDKVVFAAEGGKSKYRLKLLPTYKIRRAEDRKRASPEDQARYERFKKEEIPEALELAAMLGITVAKVKGVEADDIASYLVRHADTDKHQICVLSTDYDLMQLLRPGVVQCGYNKHMVVPLTNGERLPPKMWVNSALFKEQYEIDPAQYAHVLALAGDVSDSIVSPKGLGEGHALKMVQKYGDIYGVEANLDTLDIPRLPKKVKDILPYCYCMIHRNLMLTNLNHSPEVDCQIFGEEGKAVLDAVIAAYDEPGQVDKEAFREYCYEYGKLNIVDKLDYWVSVFE